jgi:protein translocase SecG subunit
MDFLAIGEIVISILLIISILFQQRGAGGGAIFGAGGGGTYFQKRGIERFLFWSTIVLAIILFSLAILNLVIKK